MKKYYVTTAIDYANAAPHIGHAYEKIAADIMSRFYRMQGADVFFLTGLDEHGTKVERSAQAAGLKPQEFCNQIAASFEKAWQGLNIKYDHYIRTTNAEHKAAVQAIFSKMKAKGDIYKGQYSGLYCEGCEDFVRERDLNEDGHCPNHKKAPMTVIEENYFFRLSAYKGRIKQWLVDNPKALLPEGRRKEVLNQLDDPELSDFSVSRSIKSLTWGIPVPDDVEQVIYVWIDALTNYLSGVGYNHNEERLAKFWPADLHLIGKDITKFHAIFWPAMLMSAELPLPESIYTHGFITVEGQKISKSIGNVIDPLALVTKYSADAVRFFLFAATPFDQDGDFSGGDLINKVNAELANNLGNLANRTLTLIERNCDGKIPARTPENVLREEANEIKVKVDNYFKQCQFAKAIEAIFALVDQANKYMNDAKPWALFKEGEVEAGETVLYTVAELLRRVSLMLYPVTPKLCSDIWSQLGYDQGITEYSGERYLDLIPAGQKIKNSGPVFMRLEEEEKPKTHMDEVFEKAMKELK